MVASTIYLPTHFGVPEDYAEAIAERLSAEIGISGGEHTQIVVVDYTEAVQKLIELVSQAG